jgi:hypothetical protein
VDPGYEVTAVDGKPVERARSPICTVVPYAIIEPGVHTLSLKPPSWSNIKATTVSASFESGKRYRLELNNEEVTVVEDTD